MLKPVCFPCQRFFRMQKSGFYFTEGMPTTSAVARGSQAQPGDWKPYKIWSGDVWVCQGCGATILAGFGLQPVSEQHKEGFEDLRERLGADQYQVNDC